LNDTFETCKYDTAFPYMTMSYGDKWKFSEEYFFQAAVPRTRDAMVDPCTLVGTSERHANSLLAGGHLEGLRMSQGLGVFPNWEHPGSHALTTETP